MQYQIHFDNIQTLREGEFKILGSYGDYFFIESQSPLNAPFMQRDEALFAQYQADKAETLQRTKAQMQETLENAFNLAFKGLVGEPNTNEILSWATQEAEARAFNAGNNANDAPFLSILAKQRGLTLRALASKVLEKAAGYKEKGAKLLGMKQAFSDSIEQAKSIEDLNKIQIDFTFQEVKFERIPLKVQD
ncbi:hypothetical protein [Helicobacter sp.]|uniref:hypothetical protein n=1 Tax=Helicobacter sp. TaxID=218 RepID=UPI002A74C943|nr:hypothetical protein [Helicobacter sp.]MDY2584173.1 hypothetical protein [Helicobacter sp.]